MLLNIAGEKSKSYVIKRLIELGSSPYLKDYQYDSLARTDNNRIPDSKVISLLDFSLIL